jgi:hypothetical protein
MTIDQRRFLELAVHVKLASESMIAAARHLRELRPPAGDEGEEGAWRKTMDELIAMNVELGFMERILRRTARANAPRPTSWARKGRSLAP